jgi:ubiquinone/menaquinone biosynthesis C-methylase UbiE
MSESQLFAATTFTEIYERVLVGPLCRPFATELVRRLKRRPGDSLIDVACGTGVAARIGRETLGESARIVGVDAAPPMLAVARTVEPAIDWREGSAAALPVGAEEHFTLATCHQGLQFFPDKSSAVGEMHRVLSPGGRLGIATWSAIEDIPLMRELDAVVERHVGPIADSRHSFGRARGAEGARGPRIPRRRSRHVRARRALPRRRALRAAQCHGGDRNERQGQDDE